MGRHDVDAMLAEMPSRTFAEWIAFAELEQEETADGLQTAALGQKAATLARMGRKG